MALARTDFSLAVQHGRGAVSAGFTTGSFSLPANALILVVAHGVANNNSSVRPSSFTLVNSASLTSSTELATGNPAQWGYGIRVWSLQTTSAVSSTFTVKCGTENIEGWDVEVLAFTGYSTANPVVGAVVGTDADGTGAASLTLANAPASGSMTLCWVSGVVNSGSPTVTAGTGFTNLHYSAEDGWGYFQSAYRTGSTSSTVPWGNVGSGGSPLEVMLAALTVKVATGGSTYTCDQVESGTAADAPANTGSVSAVTVTVLTAADAVTGGPTTYTPAQAETGTAAEATAATLVSTQARTETLTAADSPATASAFTVTLKQKWFQGAGQGNPPTLITGSNPMSITAGSTLVAFWSAADNISVPAPTDNAGTFTTPSGALQNAAGSDNIWLGMAHQANASSGNHTITPVSVNAGGGGEYALWIVEVTGMPASITVRNVAGVSVQSSTQSWSVSSDSSPVAGDVSFAVTNYENTVTLADAQLTDPPSGWTSIAAIQDASGFIPTELCYKLVTSGGVQTATWSTVDTHVSEHCAIMMTLVPNAASGSTYTPAQAETGTAADTAAASQTGTAARAEVGAAADTPAGALVSTQAQAEALTGASTQDGALAATVAGSEAGAVADSPAAALGAPVAATEALAGSDTLGTTAAGAVDGVEAGTATDTATDTLVAGAAQAEALTAAAEQDTGPAFSAVDQAETAVPADTQANTAALPTVVAEVTAGADTLGSTATQTVGRTDAGAATDTNTTGSIGVVTQVEALLVVDVQDAVRTLSGVLVEVLAAGELSDAAAAFVGAAVESGTLQDLNAAGAYLLAQVADLAFVEELADADIASLVTTGDALNAADIAVALGLSNAVSRVFLYPAEVRTYAFAAEGARTLVFGTDSRTHAFDSEGPRTYLFGA